MPVLSGKLTIGTVAVEIPVTSVMPWTLEIHNNDNSDALYLGGSAVTTNTGMQLNKIERVVIDGGPLDRFYLVSTKAGHVASWVAVVQGE